MNSLYQSDNLGRDVIISGDPGQLSIGILVEARQKFDAKIYFRD